MKELEYPFDPGEIIRKKKILKRQLLSEKKRSFFEKKIAILGGVTTDDVKLILELFLLNQGIRPSFYESEYGQYYEEGMFLNTRLEKFSPDIIYICTSVRNIQEFPMLSDDAEAVEQKLENVKEKFYGLWEHLENTYRCPVIQNNFELPSFRLMGNMDASDIHGRVNFVTRLNSLFYEYAQSHKDFFICDINYISASYGLEKWSDPYYWYLYKYALAVPAIPYLSFNVSNIIKSIYGRNKKAFSLDADHTLWGGVIGDDGAENIEIGQETALAQVYSEFQEYLKLHKQLGVLLTINSKNEKDSILSGLERPDSVLRPDDFVSIKGNWEPKNRNLAETAEDLNLLPESFVFVDDNPAERAVISAQNLNEGVSVPELSSPEYYIQYLDKSGFFEVTSYSGDDLARTEMYHGNEKRRQLQQACFDYEDYLRSLEMEGEIQKFTPVYMSRIAQLTNKSNQFNLTAKRYSCSELEALAQNQDYITLYGKLKDRFGDNGVVSAVIGRIGGESRGELHMELWLMSCRVLKREMESAMMDELIKTAGNKGIKTIIGYYYPTSKNMMVKDFYASQGFVKCAEENGGNTVWQFEITGDHKKKQHVISVNGQPAEH